jgi:hypothetical protein
MPMGKGQSTLSFRAEMQARETIGAVAQRNFN